MMKGFFKLLFLWAVLYVHTGFSLCTDGPEVYVINSKMDCSNSSGSFVLLPDKGTPPYEYSINNGATFSSDSVYSNLPGGAYIIIVKDANNCTVTYHDTIDYPLQIEDVIIKPSCAETPNGGIEVKLKNGSGNYYYKLNPLGTFASSNTLQNVSSGSYSIKVKDDLGCEIDTTIVIGQVPVISPIYAISPVPCQGGSTGSVDVSFSNTASYSFTLDSNPVVVGVGYINASLASGEHILHIEDENGCSVVDTFDILVEYITDSVDIINETCNKSNGEVTLNVKEGQAPFQYSFGASGLGSQQNFTSLSSGVYPIKVTDARGCEYLDSITVSNIGGITMDMPATDSICKGDNTNLFVNHTGGVGTTFLWNHGLPSTQSNLVSPIQNTSYTVVGTDIYGCKDTSNIMVSVFDYPVLSTDSLIHRVCLGDSLRIQVQGATSYLWNTGDTSSLFVTEIIGNTVYSVEGSNYGCTDNLSIQVFANPKPIVNISANQTVVEAGDTVSFSSSGTISSIYEWDFGDGGISLAPNPDYSFKYPGLFPVVFKAQMGHCYAYDTVYIQVGILSVSEYEESNLTIYPNPVQDVLNIKTEEEIKIQLIDISGKVISVHELSRGNNRIDMKEKFTSGIYFIQSISSKNIFDVYKVIKE